MASDEVYAECARCGDIVTLDRLFPGVSVECDEGHEVRVVECYAPDAGETYEVRAYDDPTLSDGKVCVWRVGSRELVESYVEVWDE